MTHDPSPNRQPIAVVGVSALFPGSTDATGFWQDILAGTRPDPRRPAEPLARRGLLRPRPGGARQDLREARRVPRPGRLRRARLGRSPSTIPATDTSQLLALVVAQKVLEDAAPRAVRDDGPLARLA